MPPIRFASGLLLCLGASLLAGCGGSSPAKVSATATATTGLITTAVPRPTATTNPALVCSASTLQASDGPITQSGAIVMQVKPNLLSASGQYRLPDTVGQSPSIVRSFQTASEQYAVAVNITSYVFTICNTGPQAVTLSAVTVELTQLTPLASTVLWADICHSTYQRPIGVHAGGCGGGIGADSMGTATFPANTQAGARATLTDDAHVFPLAIAPSRSVTGVATIAGLSTPGTYTFTLRFALGATTASVATAPMPAHLSNQPWTGDTCVSPAMQSQIPTSGTDAWICPPTA
ncbi:MAG TPA: hypothetical protein VF807_07990 [Ktedonobacterales bacterium]